jgi:stearoyl-CoA desaturase (delta-9 desaturase)
VDTDRDPYNIKRGFLWAHIGWIFYRTPPDRSFQNVPDLTRNRLVMLQHRWGTVVGIVAGLGLPTLIGAAFGRPLGGLLWGGLLRIVFVHHTTFFVNSLAHFWGSQPYTDENTARDNWLVAYLTNGEGYHNFHHRFAGDYRNGIRWWQFDPGKWLIRCLAGAGLASNLRETPAAVIEEARRRMELKRSEAHRARQAARPGVPAHG